MQRYAANLDVSPVEDAINDASDSYGYYDEEEESAGEETKKKKKVSKLKLMQKKWNSLVTEEGVGFAAELTKPTDDDHPKELMDSPFSSVLPYYRFLQHEDDGKNGLLKESYEPTAWGKLGVHEKMFVWMQDKMPNYVSRINELVDEYQPIKEAGHVEVKNELPAVDAEDQDYEEAAEDGVDINKEGDNEEKVKQSYNNCNQSGYRLHFVADTLYAIQTIYDFEKPQQLRIAFHKVVDDKLETLHSVVVK